MQEFAITNDKTKRPVVLRTKTLADLLECMLNDCFKGEQKEPAQRSDLDFPSQALALKLKRKLGKLSPTCSESQSESKQAGAAGGAVEE